MHPQRASISRPGRLPCPTPSEDRNRPRERRGERAASPRARQNTEAPRRQRNEARDRTPNPLEHPEHVPKRSGSRSVAGVLCTRALLDSAHLKHAGHAVCAGVGEHVRGLAVERRPVQARPRVRKALHLGGPPEPARGLLGRFRYCEEPKSWLRRLTCSSAEKSSRT